MRRPSIYVLLVGLVLITGCSVLKNPELEQRVYQLLPPEYPRVATLPRIEADLVISRVTAQPGYASTAMAYRQSDYELRYFSQSRWSEHPPRMLQPALVSGLAALGPFRHVVSNQSGAPTDYRLEIELIRLEQDFRQSPSRVSLGLSVQLIHEASRQIKLNDTFTVVQITPTETAEGGVIAANAAMTELLQQVADALYATVSSASP